MPLVITEGVRKADAAASIGLRAIDLLGVWGWRGRNEDGGITALDAWNAIALNDGRPGLHLLRLRRDDQERPCTAAVAALTRFLEHRGAYVRIIYLPHGEDGRKIGLDDFLAAGHTRDDLLALASDTLRPLASDPKSARQAAGRSAAADRRSLDAVAQVLDRYVRLPSRRAVLAIALWAFTPGRWTPRTRPPIW